MNRKLVPPAVAALAVIGAIPAVAASAPSRTIALHASVHAHPVVLSAHLAVLAGEVHDPRLGDGAVVYRVTYPQRTFTFVQYTTRGTFRGRGDVTLAATPGSDGTSPITGSARVTGGTGSYRGARGILVLRGSSTPDFTDTITVTGDLRLNP